MTRTVISTQQGVATTRPVWVGVPHPWKATCLSQPERLPLPHGRYLSSGAAGTGGAGRAGLTQGRDASSPGTRQGRQRITRWSLMLITRRRQAPACAAPCDVLEAP